MRWLGVAEKDLRMERNSEGRGKRRDVVRMTTIKE